MRKTSKGKEMDAFEMDATVYAVPNSDPAEQVNTILKMADKRALVAATLIATGLSEYFTQDIEDYTTTNDVIEGEIKSTHISPENISQETGQETKPAELFKPMSDHLVKIAAKFWNIEDGDAAKAISKAGLKAPMSEAEFDEWLRAPKP